MPHAFRPHPKHPAINALVRLHADLGGKIWENKAEAARLADAMRHVEAVIKMFDPAYNVAGIAVRRRYKGNPWFKRGTLFRNALDVLRKAEGPLTAREISARLLKEAGVHSPTLAQIRLMYGAVNTSLKNHAGKTIRSVGEGMPRRWTLIR